MIKYEWREDLSTQEAEELEALLVRAAQHDAEPEYGTIDFADVQRAMRRSDRSVRHLVIWMLARSVAMDQPDEPERIAGLLRLQFGSASAAEASVVIDPALRSIGILTLLLEQVGLNTDDPDGWMGTGAHTITAWARGNHPATGRISNRFLIPRTRRIWKLIRSAESFERATAAPVLERIGDTALNDLGWAAGRRHSDRLLALRESGRVVGLVSLDLRPVESIEFGSCATVEQAIAAPTADPAARRRLLDGAAAVAHDAGHSGVIVYVDSDDTALVNACRLTDFQHDRTDVRYQLGGSR